MAYHPYSQKQFHTTKIVVVMGLFLVAYMLYNLTVTIYENHQIDLHIEKFETKNAQLESENAQKLADYEYYTSEQYIEKVAKENLNLINPGEQVIIITEADSESFSEADVIAENKERTLANLSNPQKWWKFIFQDNPFRN